MDTVIFVQDSAGQTFEQLKVLFAGIISLASVIVAFRVYSIRRREPWGRALFEIVKLMETDKMRHLRRKVVYACNPEQPGTWIAPGLSSEDTHAALDRWGAHMDMISLLYFSHQLDNLLFFEMYGDVMLRSIYRLAPYANEQRLKRGEQFWLPYQLLTRDMLLLWKKRAKQRLYPPQIGLMERPDLLTFDSMLQNTELRRFLTANGRTTL